MSIKQVSVTFEFDTETELVSNVHAFVDGIEKKKRTTRKKAEVEEPMADEPLVTREDNKLVFNNKAVADMELTPENRIVIKYEKVDKLRVPIVGTDLAWNEEGSGNKVTKTFTVVYRGKANTVLSDYGTIFKLIPHGEGTWRMVSTDPFQEPKTYEEATDLAEKVIPEIYTTDDDTTEIEELTFKL